MDKQHKRDMWFVKKPKPNPKKSDYAKIFVKKSK